MKTEQELREYLVTLEGSIKDAKANCLPERLEKRLIRLNGCVDATRWILGEPQLIHPYTR